MDQPTLKPNAPDSLLVTMTVGQLRHLIREEIQAARAPEQDADRLLSAEEAAEMLSMSTDWLYRNARKLPFTRKLARRCSGLANAESSNGLRVENRIDLLTYICRERH
jgi:predicted DNA-binding transcriptional regulator AlpA